MNDQKASSGMCDHMESFGMNDHMGSSGMNDYMGSSGKNDQKESACEGVGLLLEALQSYSAAGELDFASHFSAP